MPTHDINLFTTTSTSADDIDRGDSSAQFSGIMLNREGRLQNLFDSCQHGYVIQCNSDPILTNEIPVLVAMIALALIIIAIVVMFLVKNIRDKGNTIKDLQRELSKRRENYGKLENDA